jgi:hypothetical protein
MRKLLYILSFTIFTALAVDMTMTVDQLTSFIKSSVEKKFPDKQVAEYLKHVKLANKLDDRTVEDLQGLGAGPKTIAALHDLRDTTEKLPPPPPPPVKPVYKQPDPPDSIEQAKIIDEAREYAMNYDKQLPDFMCAEIQRRYVDPYHRTARSLEEQPDWRLEDTITSKLTYFDHQEKYEVQMVNNTSVTNMAMEKLGGAVSRGEFGSMMRYIFDLSSQARFEWDHWGTLRGRLAYVFNFDIDQANSKYQIVWDNSLELRPAYRGKIYIDKETKMIVRIVESPYDIPSTYPVRAVTDTVDFDFAKIGDSEYLVPMKAVIVSATSKYLARNDKEFRMYQKFGTASTIKFDITPDPLPPEKTQEKPPQ